MLTFLFAVFLGLGTIAAIRRNPAYSGSSLLRSAVICLVAVGAMIAVIVAAVNFTAHKSPAIAGITMAAVVIFGTLGMIYLVRVASTPKIAKLIDR